MMCSTDPDLHDHRPVMINVEADRIRNLFGGLKYLLDTSFEQAKELYEEK